MEIKRRRNKSRFDLVLMEMNGVGSWTKLWKIVMSSLIIGKFSQMKNCSHFITLPEPITKTWRSIIKMNINN